MQFDLTLSPSISEFVVRPGGGFTQAYDVVNNSSDIVFLKTSVEPFDASGDQGLVTYGSTSQNPSIVFSLNNADIQMGQTFKLAPGQKQQLVLKVKTLPDYKGDAYYTFFITQDSAGALQNEPTANAKIGSHLLLSLSSKETTPINSKISAFSSAPFIKDIFFTPINFDVVVDNSGSYFFKTNGTISVSKNGKELQKLNLFPQNVLAHHSRQVSCSPPESSVQNQESSIPVPCSLRPPFWPGVYSATLTINGDTPSTSTIQFFVFPYYLTLLVLALTLFTVFLLRLLRRR